MEKWALFDTLLPRLDRKGYIGGIEPMTPCERKRQLSAGWRLATSSLRRIGVRSFVPGVGIGRTQHG